MALFPNERKASDKHPDFTGQGLVNGVEVWASMWVKRSSKTGEEFFSISVRPKDEARRESAQRQEQARVQKAYFEDSIGDPPPRSAPSRFQRPAQPPRNQAPPAQSQEWPEELNGDWEQEP
jgi:hypothetical protein